MNLLSLGFGGQAVLDESLSRLIRDLPADAISLKLGINVHNHGCHGLRSFGQAVLGAILTIRDGHPTTPPAGNQVQFFVSGQIFDIR